MRGKQSKPSVATCDHSCQRRRAAWVLVRWRGQFVKSFWCGGVYHYTLSAGTWRRWQVFFCCWEASRYSFTAKKRWVFHMAGHSQIWFTSQLSCLCDETSVIIQQLVSSERHTFYVLYNCMEVLFSDSSRGETGNEWNKSSRECCTSWSAQQGHSLRAYFVVVILSGFFFPTCFAFCLFSLFSLKKCCHFNFVTIINTVDLRDLKMWLLTCHCWRRSNELTKPNCQA